MHAHEPKSIALGRYCPHQPLTSCPPWHLTFQYPLCNTAIVERINGSRNDQKHPFLRHGPIQDPKLDFPRMFCRQNNRHPVRPSDLFRGRDEPSDGETNTFNGQKDEVGAGRDGARPGVLDIAAERYGSRNQLPAVTTDQTSALSRAKHTGAEWR